MAENREDEEAPEEKPAYIETASAGTDALVKICGLGNMRLALLLDDLCQMLRDKGCRQLAIDLSACTGMDSTFMGTLVTIGCAFSESGGWMCLVNVSPENQKLMEMLGVASLVQTKENFPLEPLTVTRLELPPTDNAKKRLALIKKAHERLVEIDGHNREKFGAFLEMLNASLAADGGREHTADQAE